MNKLTDQRIDELAWNALDGAIRHMQDALGVKTGDVAGMCFDEGDVLAKFAEYIRTELAYAEADAAERESLR